MNNLGCRDNDFMFSWESISEHMRKSLKGWDLLAMRRREEEEKEEEPEERREEKEN